MADYYSILRKTIDGLPNNTPEIRQAVYRKARAAIEKQLRNMSPPPSEAAIQSQLKLLEESILVVDSEYTLVATPEPTAAAPVAPEPPAAPVPPSAPATADVAPPAAASLTPTPAPVETPQVAQTPPPAPVEVSADVPPPVVTEVPPVPSQNDTVDAPSSVPPQAPATVAMEPGPLAGSRSETADYAESKRKSGFVGKALGTLVALGLLGGAGYAVWINKDTLGPMVTSLVSGDEKPAEEAAAPSENTQNENDELIDQDTAAQAEKEPVKLGADGQDTSVSTEPEQETVTLVPEEEPLPPANEDEAASEETDPVVEPVEEVVEDTTGQNGGEQQALPIGEVAYLYEEGSAGSGASRTNAAIAWSLKRESLGEGLPAEPIIVGNMEVPEKSLSLDIEIKRNIDEALSASHIIELRFDVPQGFTGGTIDNIARFVMKATEEARGEPLVAVPVKVSEGYFLIALDNLQQAVDVNTQLMLDSAWIDVPVSYGTGKRALVTLEKGGTGERIFQEAFKDWQNR